MVRQIGSAPAVILRAYKVPQQVVSGVHNYVRKLQDDVLRGQLALRQCLELKKLGFIPDLIVAHTGWGDALYLLEAFPDSKIIGYFEYYFHACGADVGFDPEFPMSMDNRCEVETKNSTQLLSWANCDQGWSPTQWQASLYPKVYRPQINVIHDGINTQLIQSNSGATYTLPCGRVLGRSDEVLTLVNRNMEPYRGFHVFMRALPEIQKRRPNAITVIVGSDDDVAYGDKPKTGKSWRQTLLDEVGSKLDMRRLHFVGTLKYREYLSVLQVSRAHVYMTYPYILSWSMIESMAAECLVIGSNTPPVTEVIRDGENGLLFDFFDQRALVERVEEALANPARFDEIRRRARRSVIEQYDLESICIPQQIKFMQTVLG